MDNPTTKNLKYVFDISIDSLIEFGFYCRSNCKYDCKCDCKYDCKCDCEFSRELTHEYIEKLELELFYPDKNMKFTENISNCSQLCIGDIVKLSYVPYSQLCIDVCNEYNCIGKIFHVNTKTNDAIVYFDCFDEEANHVIRHVRSIRKNHDDFLLLMSKE